MGEPQVFEFILILSRVSSFVAFFPLFSQRQLPVTVKSGLAIALTMFWYGSVPASTDNESVPMLMAAIGIFKEVGIGALLAMVLGFLFIPARIAGAYVGQEVGLSLASISDPSTSDQSTLVTKIFETLAIMLFFGLNVHHFLIVFLHFSMNHLANKISLLDLPTEGLVGLVSELPEKGLLIIAPIGLMMFVLLIGLAFLNKAAPTMNLFSIGMTLRSGLGLVCLVFFMPVIIQSIAMFFSREIKQLEQLLGYF